MRDEILTKIAQIVGQSYVVQEQSSTYLTDWRGRYHGQALAIVKPQSIEQIVQLVKLCQMYHISIIPQGGNTSLCGGATPLNIANQLQLVINLSLLNKIIEIDTKNNSITVEAGCTLEQIINLAEQHNRYFPLNIASLGTCQIGGNIATNAGGIHVIKYGMMRDLTLGLEAVLPDSTVINQLNKLRKNNTYIDLKQLLIGSEGTLGIITKAVLKLFPLPKGYITGLVGLENISQSIDLFNQLNQDFNLCAYEIIGKTVQNIYKKHFPDNKFPISNEWLILFEIEENNLNSVLDIIAKYNINHDELILSDADTQRSILWNIRESLPLAEKRHGIAIKHDISLPISQIENFIKINQENIHKQFPNAEIIIFGHLGDGNLHYNVQLQSINETLANENLINQIVYTDVLTLGGSISAEHGIGQLKAFWYKKATDTNSYILAKQLKHLIDPNNLFNPNKVFT